MVLRIFADTAGIEYDNIRLFRFFRFPIAHFVEDARDLFRFVHIHLTAVGDDMVLFFHKFPVVKFFFHYTLFYEFYQVFESFLRRFHHKK